MISETSLSRQSLDNRKQAKEKFRKYTKNKGKGTKGAGEGKGKERGSERRRERERQGERRGKGKEREGKGKGGVWEGTLNILPARLPGAHCSTSALNCSDNLPSYPPDNHRNSDGVYRRGGAGDRLGSRTSDSEVASSSFTGSAAC